MKKELKRAFTSPMFFITIVIFFLILQGYSIPIFISNLIEPIEYRESAFQLIFGGIFFGGAILLQPFCAPTVHAISQVDDLRSGIMQLSVLRSSVLKHTIRKVSVTFISTFVAIGGAFAIHSLIWNIIALPYNPEVYPAHFIELADDCLFNVWKDIFYGLPAYVAVSLGLGFTAGVWSVVSLAFAVWIPDKLLTVTIPVCIYELWSGNFTKYLFGVRLARPDTLFNELNTPELIKDVMIIYTIIFLIALLFYYKGVKRRSCNA